MADKEQTVHETDDAIIAMFLSLVEEDGIEVEITLNVKGVIVSGLLIGPSTYYQGITESAKGLHDETMSKILSKKLNDLKEAYLKQKQEEEEKEEEGQENPYSFIHLKNAVYLNINGQSTLPSSGTWWRGAISSIDGFSFIFNE